jgi:pimeloyl-ACP methyl ester carboxylesterase
MHEAPLLLTAGGRDHTVPRATTKATLRLHRNSSGVTDYKEFPDRGHSLIIDSGWPDVADALLERLQTQSPGAQAP